MPAQKSAVQDPRGIVVPHTRLEVICRGDAVLKRTASWTLSIAAAVVAAAAAVAAQTSPGLNAELERIFARDEYEAQTVAQPAWIDGGARYAAVEPSASVTGARDIVEYDSATGQRTVLVAASALKPAGAAAPLVDRRLRVVGGSRPAAGVHELEEGLAAEHPRRLLGARPRFGRAAQARRRRRAVDVDVRQVLAGRPARRLRARSRSLRRGRRRRCRHPADQSREPITSSTARPTGCTKRSSTCATRSAGARMAGASPTGSSTRAGIDDFTLINDTDTLYPALTRIPYPKAGTTNSAVRIGVVDAAGGPTTWVQTPGDPRDTYLPRIEWAADGRVARRAAAEPAAEPQRRADGRRAHRRRQARASRRVEGVGRRRRRVHVARRRPGVPVGEREGRLASSVPGRDRRQRRAPASRSSMATSSR